jgi:hypothetical protein
MLLYFCCALSPWTLIVIALWFIVGESAASKCGVHSEGLAFDGGNIPEEQ